MRERQSETAMKLEKNGERKKTRFQKKTRERQMGKTKSKKNKDR